jgi:hypothetical protein
MANEGQSAQSQDDDWCGINEAARRLHVTPTAIRNRIRRGTLEVRSTDLHRLVRVPRPMAGTVPQAVPETSQATKEHDPTAERGRHSSLTELERRVVALEADNAALRKEMAEASEHLRMIYLSQISGATHLAGESSELREGRELQSDDKPWWKRLLLRWAQ